MDRSCIPATSAKPRLDRRIVDGRERHIFRIQVNFILITSYKDKQKEYP